MPGRTEGRLREQRAVAIEGGLSGRGRVEHALAHVDFIERDVPMNTVSWLVAK